MPDHDQRFKLLLQAFFAEFLRLFFPALAARFDFSNIVWLDKEVFADPPQGERGYLDLVAQLQAREPIGGQRAGESDSTVALIHVEIERAESVHALRSRMHQYYEQLRRRHGLPVLPIALYLRLGLDGIGKDVYQECFWEERVLTFEYHYVGLPALKAEEYIEGENPLGVALAALMNAPAESKLQLALRGLRRLVNYPVDAWRKFLLGDCLIAYSAMDTEQKNRLSELLDKDENREVRTMTTTWYDEALEKGEQKGLARGVNLGKRELLLSLLQARFKVTDDVRKALEAWPAERLEELSLALFSAKSLKELGLER